MVLNADIGHLKHILLVDDDATFSTGLRLLLEKNGYATNVSLDAENAWAQFTKQKFDIIIADIKLPGRSGLKFISDIRKRDQSTSIIAISAGGYIPAEDYLRIAKLFGANAALAKPFLFEQLLKEINDLTV